MTGRLQRDWRPANATLREADLACRVCRARSMLERAHVSGRARDARTARGRVVGEHDIVWLCKSHHVKYDSHALDLYPYLSDVERLAAIERCGGPGPALRQLSAPLWRLGTAAAVKTLDERLLALLELHHGREDRPDPRGAD